MANAQTRIYLDVCTLCRPYDDQHLMRIRLETDAFYLLLQHRQHGRYIMIVSVLALPMPHTLPLRRPLLTYSLHAMSDCLDNAGVLGCLYGSRAPSIFALQRIYDEAESIFE